LRLPEIASSTISAYTLSSASSNHIFAGTKTGFLALWDWSTGQLLRKWHTNSWIREIVSGAENQSQHPIIYTHEVLGDGDSAVIKVHELHEDHGEVGFSDSSSYKLLTLAERALSFQVLLGGRIIVVALASGLFIGERQLMEKRSLEDVRYVWREMHVNSPITCFDIHMGSVSPTWNQDFNSRDAPQFDIAIGTEDGQITIYEDIINRLIHFEKSPGKPEHWLPRQLHWHRRPLGSVRWSRDGKQRHKKPKEDVF
jgi:NET1-associated nuclear protein 1 (U3 small nucleolar RNA-associated protein 17)